MKIIFFKIQTKYERGRPILIKCRHGNPGITSQKADTTIRGSFKNDAVRGIVLKNEIWYIVRFERIYFMNQGYLI